MDKSLGADGLIAQLLGPVRASLMAMSKDLTSNPSWLYILSLRFGELFREVSRDENHNHNHNQNGTNTTSRTAVAQQSSEELTVAYALEGTEDSLASAAGQIEGSATTTTGALRVQGKPIEISEEEYRLLLNPHKTPSSEKDFPTWAIVLIAVVGAILLVLVVAVVMYFAKRTPKQANKEDPEDINTEPVDV